MAHFSFQQIFLFSMKIIILRLLELDWMSAMKDVLYSKQPKLESKQIFWSSAWNCLETSGLLLPLQDTVISLRCNYCSSIIFSRRCSGFAFCCLAKVTFRPAVCHNNISIDLSRMTIYLFWLIINRRGGRMWVRQPSSWLFNSREFPPIERYWLLA